ncbi:MAG: CpaE family protein [Hyphomonadaceae bacterium]
MSELRIAARVRDPDLLAGVKTAAATYRARFLHWTDALGLDSHLQDADLVVLEAANSNSALAELNSAKGACPRAEIIIFAPSATTPDDVRRLFRAGAKDVLGLPVAHDQLMSALGEALGPGPMGDSNGFVLAIAKSAGGVGATTLAVNLAGHFANPPRGKRGDRLDPLRVALLDLDVQFGAAALALDIAPRKDVTEILRSPKRLDAHFLDGVLERHRSGIRVLAAPQTTIPLDAIDSTIATAIVNVAASTHDIVIVELPMAMTDWTGALLRRADHVLLVSSVAVRGIAGARRILDAAADLNVDQSHWSLAFNRLNSVLDGNDIIDQAKRALGAPVLGALGEDPAVRVAGDRGRMIWETAPATRFAKDMRPLCVEITQMLEARAYPHAQRLPAR